MGIAREWDISLLIRWETLFLIDKNIEIIVAWIIESITSCIVELFYNWRVVLTGFVTVAGVVVVAGAFQRMYEFWLDNKEERTKKGAE